MIKTLIVTNEYENQRIDKVLVDLLEDLSRSEIQTMIQNEHVLVNGLQTKNNYRLKLDDEVSYEIIDAVIEVKPIKMDLDIVYEDEHIIVLNKPKDLIVHPSPTSLDTPTLVHALLAHTDNLSDIGGELRPGIVHRLDKDTSGLLLIAKTNEAHEVLAENFKAHTINRSYLALVHHEFNHGSAMIDAPIGRDPKNRQKMAVTHINGKEARTKVFLEERLTDYSLLRCELETGRTHQIRVHLQYIEHPVVGDKTYSYKNTLDTQGQCLHAFQLEFVHPITKEFMSFETQPPQIFLDMLTSLRSTHHE